MGFRPNAYMKVWSVECFERYSKANISSSRKNRETGEYETDFSGFVTLIGSAHKKAVDLGGGERIKITACDVTTKYDKGKGIKYTNFTVFDWEPADNPKEPVETPVSTVEEEGASDDELPF